MSSTQEWEIVPARAVLEEIEQEGAEHLGPVSVAHGFQLRDGSRLRLPESHRAWDEMAARLPELWRDMSARRVILELPMLGAGEEELPDEDLWRASLTLSCLAYSYARCDLEDLHREAPVPMPACVAEPWRKVAERMGRRGAHLAYDDLFTHNWRLLDPHREDPLRVENFDLLVRIVGSEAERLFFGGNIEINAQLAPVVGAVVRAQEAAVRDDREAVVEELLLVLERVRHITDVSLMKIDPNVYAEGFADPAVWAKLVAPTGIRIVEGVPGVSGAGSPALQLVDAFLGRTRYESMLGREGLHARDWYAPNIRRFLDAVEEVSVRDYVQGRGDPELSGLFQSLVDAYAGERGYLGVHKRKVYGFIQTAFKVGRPATASGISGGFTSRVWTATYGHLEDARRERYEELFDQAQVAMLASREDATSDGKVKRVTLNVTDTGLVFRPGDRCAVLPVHSDELVERTLRALRATGDESVPLTSVWRQALRTRSGGREAPEQVALREFLKAARLRPLERPLAKVLQELSASPELKRIIEAREEDQHELWDAIELASRAGYDPRRLWRAPLWRDECLARIVPPAARRTYSVSEDRDREPFPSALTLTVGTLQFASQGPDESAVERHGAASGFLASASLGDVVNVQVARPTRFRLPDEPERPIVMFAGGTGIAPFRGFLQARLANPRCGLTWLMVAARTREDLPYVQELEALAAAGQIRLSVAYSRESVAGAPPRRVDAAIEDQGNAADLAGLLAGDGRFYICGAAAFAATVFGALGRVAGENGDGQEAIRRLVGQGRLMSDLFTTFAPATAPGVQGGATHDASELVLHNDQEHGWWMAVSGAVYDMTEFRHLHPGGRRIVDDNAGLDATTEYQALLHHEDSEIEAMLAMYKIGFLRRLDFGPEWGIAIHQGTVRYVPLVEFFRSWTRHLYLIVQMENSLGNDFSVLESSLGGEPPAQLTRLKIMLAADVQGRFLTQYLPDAIGERLEELWAFACGLLDEDEDAARLPRMLRQMADGPVGLRAREATSRFRALAGEGALHPEYSEPLLTSLRQADADLLAALKGRLREGLMSFEQHESRLLDEHDGRIVTVLEAICADVEIFYGRVAAAVEGHAEQMSSAAA